MPALLGMFGVGPQELVVLAIIVLLLFGNRLPSVMRSLGRGVVEFKKGVSGEEDENDEKGDHNKGDQNKGEHKP
jgi:sec-independent protein translocase protein TatA